MANQALWMSFLLAMIEDSCHRKANSQGLDGAVAQISLLHRASLSIDSDPLGVWNCTGGADFSARSYL